MSNLSRYSTGSGQASDIARHQAIHKLARNWTKFTQKDFENAILKRAFRSGALLESAHRDPVIRVLGKEHFEIIFTHLLHGSFVDMGVGRKGFGSFKPQKWYAKNMSYSLHRLSLFMLRKYGQLGAARVSEIFPDTIKLG